MTEMTREEFLEGMRDMAADFNDPSSEFSQIMAEFQTGEDMLAASKFDPELGRHFQRIGDAFAALRTYVLTRVS